MTSTWHRVAGPMAELIDRGRAGHFPVDTYCIFEVLERCPDERSGPDLEQCPECPLVRWCHSDRETHPRGLPKAKRCNGHYTIDSLIQKVKSVSARVFESDYLCLRPKAAGVWFAMFDEQLHVTEGAEYDPASGPRGGRPGRSYRRGLVPGPARSTAAATRSISSPTTSPRSLSRVQRRRDPPSIGADLRDRPESSTGLDGPRRATRGRRSDQLSAANTNEPAAKAETDSNRGPPERKSTGLTWWRPC